MNYSIQIRTFLRSFACSICSESALVPGLNYSSDTICISEGSPLNVKST